MITLSARTFGMAFGLVTMLFANSSYALGTSEAVYYTIDTTTPMDVSQLASLCEQQFNQVQPQLTSISTRLTGNANRLEVFYSYSQNPFGIGPINPPNPQVESVCYLTFVSHDPKVLFNAFSAVEMTELTAATWDTACKPVYDQLVADPNTLITDYDKSATLFQGRICEVTAVQAVVQSSLPPTPTPTPRE
jgi:hypothetical protein